MVSINDVMARLRQTERSFIGTELLAPILPGHPVRARVGGVVCVMRTRHLPQTLPDGFAVLQVVSDNMARFVRAATRREVDEYLKLFPAVRLIALAAREDGTWLTTPYGHYTHHKYEGLIPLQRVMGNLEMMDVVKARFDGTVFWFEARAAGSTVRQANELRRELAKFDADNDEEPLAADALRISGLVPEHRAAYALARAAQGAKVDRVANRLQNALRHAGAEFRDYLLRDGAYVVHYTVDGKPQTSLVRADDLTVQTAGICLNHTDRAFDLTSLVSVLREGERRGKIVATPLREAQGIWTDEDDPDDD